MSADSMFFVRPGQTVDWQPLRYKLMKLSGGPVFKIRIRNNEERQENEDNITTATYKDMEERKAGRPTFHVKTARAELVVNYVQHIKNVEGWIVGKDEVELLTVNSPEQISAVVRVLPGSDGQDLENSILDIQSLLSGEVVKNSNSSPELPVTNPGGETTDAKIAKD